VTTHYEDGGHIRSYCVAGPEHCYMCEAIKDHHEYLDALRELLRKSLEEVERDEPVARVSRS
jgi:hypothetical protein